MPQRLISNGMRGWGKETRVDATLRMSRKSLLSTRVKNQHENNRFGQEMEQLGRKRESEEIRYDKDIRKTREQLRRFVASGQVYKQHSFDKYDPFKRQKSAKRDITNIPGYRNDRYWKEGEQKPKVEEIANDPSKNKWASMILKTAQVSSKSPENESSDEEHSSQVKLLSQKLRDMITSKDSSNGATSSLNDKNAGNDHNQKSSAKNVFETFLKNANSEYKKPSKIPRIRRREKTFTYTRDRTIFAGQCKTTWELRKFMEKEVTDTVFSMSPEGKRRANIEILKERAKLPCLVERSKTTAAILKDFRAYKEKTRLMSAAF